MQMGSGVGDFLAPVKPKPPTYLPDPRFTAGYQNVYGTRVGVSASPVTQRASLDTQVPIGDHQRQLFLQGSAYAQPGTGTGAPSDWGFRLGLSKKIGPQGMSGGEAINRALQQNLGSSETVDASTRSRLFDTFTPEQLQILGRDAKRIQREDVDAKLGIQQGAEKYGFGFGVDVPNVKQNEDGTVVQSDPVGFAKQYAGQLQQTRFVEPRKEDPYFENQERLHRMGHYDENRRPKYNPQTGQVDLPKREEPLY